MHNLSQRILPCLSQGGKVPSSHAQTLFMLEMHYPYVGTDHLREESILKRCPVVLKGDSLKRLEGSLIVVIN
jgi:hypothetical protein